MSQIHAVLNNTELLSIIFGLLKDAIGKDAGIEPSVIDAYAPTTKWKRFFRDIGLVNRAFFHASIGVTWTHMHALEPFLYLLGPSNAEDEPIAYNAGIQTAAWQRFAFYSSKTKSLVLPPLTAYGSTSLWSSYISTANGRPDPMFPALQNLHLQSTDPLSMMVAFSVCPHIKRLEVDFPPSDAQFGEALNALSSALVERAHRLSNLQVMNPAGAQFIRNISHLKSLELLRVVMTCGDVDATGPQSWAHRHVIIEQSRIDELDIRTKNACDANIRCVSSVLERQDDTHRSLTIHGGAKLQAMLATSRWLDAASRTPFTVVTLELHHDGDGSEDLLTPVTIGTYLKQNPGLTALTVRCSPHTISRIPRETMDRARTSPTFNDTQFLLTQLAASPNLTLLNINGIPFKAGNIAVEMLALVKHLPALVSLKFYPMPMSSLDMGQCILPVLSALAEIPEHNPRLRVLGVSIRLPEKSIDFPTLPPSYVSDHLLQNLSLVTPAGYPRYTTAENLMLAKYLYRIFPSLLNMTTYGTGNATRRAFWEPVGQIYSSFQEMGELTKQHLAAALPGRPC